MGRDSRSPLKAKPLRGPGQSVDEQRRELIEDAVGQPLLLATFMIVMCGVEWWRFYSRRDPDPIGFTVAAVVVAFYAVIRISRTIPRLRSLRQAAEGEQVVGQFLEGLRAQGYRVFHDLVGDGFNVDHVLIGPAGVFTVETKTWSKPARGNAEIHFDGERLRVMGRDPDRDPIIQARAQATWIKGLLTASTGQNPFIRPVVVFPGWYIVNARRSFEDVWVLEPKALPAFLENEPARMSESDVQLLAYHLSRHIRAGEAA